MTSPVHVKVLFLVLPFSSPYLQLKEPVPSTLCRLIPPGSFPVDPLRFPPSLPSFLFTLFLYHRLFFLLEDHRTLVLLPTPTLDPSTLLSVFNVLLSLLSFALLFTCPPHSSISLVTLLILIPLFLSVFVLRFSHSSVTFSYPSFNNHSPFDPPFTTILLRYPLYLFTLDKIPAPASTVDPFLLLLFFLKNS